LGGYTKYDDDPTNHYSYDSNVANSRQVAVGDRLVFWDEVSLIGASTVASIDHWPGSKKISRCPNCRTTNIAARKTKTPRFQCDDCHAEFDVPVVDEVEVTVYQTDHQQGWVDLAGLLEGSTLRSLTGYSQNSIRGIDWDQFASAVEAAAGPTALTPVTITQRLVLGPLPQRPSDSIRAQSSASRIAANLTESLTLASLAIPNNALAIRLAACPTAKYVKLAKPCATRGPTGHRVLRSCI
jgi:hypothetical protein